ncbi:ATP phosphoribosyltransferase regulatory subunit [Rickettsiales bacterium]|nr:ATP phosphoribosyltransferase regulatory subunit [Rickettsiales bacterium]
MKSNLLPEGFRDSLPDLAKKEFLIISLFIDLMNRNGYELVKPPLFEFEKSLFLLSKNKRNTNSFRVLDPISQKMMGLRSDITSQIARIASSSFEKKDRPLRLSYFGEILKVKNSQLNISRQFTQLGAELIGINNNLYEVEILKIIIMILKNLDIKDYSIVFSMPSLFFSVCEDFKLDEKNTLFLKDKYENKNLLGIEKISDKLLKVSNILMNTIGEFEENYEELNQFDFPKKTKSEVKNFLSSLCVIKEHIPDIRVNVDPIEIDKFGYHNGILFKIYSKNLNELFSGGRYNVNDENCIGFSALVENLVKEFNFEKKKYKKILVPVTEKNVDRVELLSKNFIIVNYSEKIKKSDMNDEAKKKKCDYVMMDNQIIKVI